MRKDLPTFRHLVLMIRSSLANSEKFKWLFRSKNKRKKASDVAVNSSE